MCKGSDSFSMKALPPSRTCPNFITWGRQERSKGRATSVPPYVLGIRRLIPCLSSASSYRLFVFSVLVIGRKYVLSSQKNRAATKHMTISTWVPSSMSDVYCSVHSASIVPSFGHRLLARIVACALAMASTGGPLSRSAAWSAEYKDIFTILTNGLSLLLLPLFACAVAVKRVRPPVNR